MNKKVVLGLVLALVVTSVSIAASFKCTPCPENYYCQKGIDYSCPDSKPITNGTGAKSEADCMTCTERDGESYPYFDNLSGDCKACWQISESTPYWNGSACAACPSGTEWDGTNCKEVEPEVACTFTVPHNGETLCLVESVNSSVYGSFAPQSVAEETDEFKAKYGIVKTSGYYPDYWAGAMKYCQDKGLRLATMDELVSIMNVVYNTNKTCTTKFAIGISADKTGCCSYDNLTVTNQSLLNFLGSNSTIINITSIIFLWSNAEDASTHALSRYFNTANSNYFGDLRNSTTPRALCVK